MSQKVECAQFRSGTRFPRREATVVLEALMQIADRCHGRVSPRDVVTAAETEGSPLHRYFEWNDEVAAIEFRLVQARELLRAVIVPVTSPSGDERVMVRAFVGTGGDGEGERAYVPIGLAMIEPKVLAEVTARAAKELGAWQERYEIYLQLEEFRQAISEPLAMISAAGTEQL